MMLESKFTTVKVDVNVNGNGGGDVEFVKCECCGLTEECTAAYIAAVRGNNHGRWICGLCGEALKDEMERSPEEDALDRHMRFCKNFRSSVNSPAMNPTEGLISAVKQLLIRSLNSLRSGSGQPESSVCGRSSSSSILRSNAGGFSFHED